MISYGYCGYQELVFELVSVVLHQHTAQFMFIIAHVE